MHAVLLGDSILDNQAYTEGGPDVVTHLSELFGDGADVTLLAQDGALVREVLGQLPLVPHDATHLVVSMGGNDALNSIALLSERADSIAAGLVRLAAPLAQFDRDYAEVLDAINNLRMPVTLCTIYNGNFQPGTERTAVSTAARLFNDSISRFAHSNGCRLIELRDVCTEPTDYWNPIEPSAAGGGKIAVAIHESLSGQAG